MYERIPVASNVIPVGGVTSEYQIEIGHGLYTNESFFEIEMLMSEMPNLFVYNKTVANEGRTSFILHLKNMLSIASKCKIYLNNDVILDTDDLALLEYQFFNEKQHEQEIYDSESPNAAQLAALYKDTNIEPNHRFAIMASNNGLRRSIVAPDLNPNPSAVATQKMHELYNIDMFFAKLFRNKLLYVKHSMVITIDFRWGDLYTYIADHFSLAALQDVNAVITQQPQRARIENIAKESDAFHGKIQEFKLDLVLFRMKEQIIPEISYNYIRCKRIAYDYIHYFDEEYELQECALIITNKTDKYAAHESTYYLLQPPTQRVEFTNAGVNYNTTVQTDMTLNIRENNYNIIESKNLFHLINEFNMKKNMLPLNNVDQNDCLIIAITDNKTGGEFDAKLLSPNTYREFYEVYIYEEYSKKKE